MSLPNGFGLLVQLSDLTPYNTSSKPDPKGKGHTITTDKFRIEVLENATLRLPAKRLHAMTDVPASGNVPAHKHVDLANVQVHIYEGVEIEDGKVSGLIEINARRVTPSWSGGERRTHLSINVKPTTSTGTPTALVRTWSSSDHPLTDREPGTNYGPDSKGGNILVATL